MYWSSDVSTPAEDVVSVLLEAGADALQIDQFGQTAKARARAEMAQAEAKERERQEAVALEAWREPAAKYRKLLPMPATTRMMATRGAEAAPLPMPMH